MIWTAIFSKTLYSSMSKLIDFSPKNSKFIFQKIILFLTLNNFQQVFYTMDLSEFNVNVMIQINGEHQCSPYNPGIQKWPFVLFLTPEKNLTISRSWYIAWKWQFYLSEKKFWGLEQKERSLLNPWAIRRTLVCSVVSGHDINIEFWQIQCVYILNCYLFIVKVEREKLFHA